MDRVVGSQRRMRAGREKIPWCEVDQADRIEDSPYRFGVDVRRGGFPQRSAFPCATTMTRSTLASDDGPQAEGWVSHYAHLTSRDEIR